MKLQSELIENTVHKSKTNNNEDEEIENEQTLWAYHPRPKYFAAETSNRPFNQRSYDVLIPW